MARRLNTIIVVPHSKAKFYKFSFSSLTMTLAASGVVLAVLLSILAIAYTGSAVHRRAELQRLKAENRDLDQVNGQLERTISEVQGRLDEFEERTTRLALAAGLETESEQGANYGSQTERVGRGGPYDRLPDSPDSLRAQKNWIQSWLDMVETELENKDLHLASTPTIAPVMGIATDGYGRRKDPFTGHQAFHRGLDISARRGTPVVSPADGVVVFAGRDGGLGKVIRVSHGFGFKTTYGHLDRILVESGDEVRRGEQIGLLGSTGRSTGPHLHYEVHVDGRAVNPLYHILNAF
ncbi:MAG: M23 family metallopeptidase [bacterium]|nr:M23 family metallopeptidase [bacterium]